MYDTVIIGAGVVGCAIARELSRYRGSVCVVEREEDVCCGTSKANSAIIHAGFDALPGTKKAQMNVRGNQMMDALSRELDFRFTETAPWSSARKIRIPLSFRNCWNGEEKTVYLIFGFWSERNFSLWSPIWPNMSPAPSSPHRRHRLSLPDDNCHGGKRQCQRRRLSLQQPVEHVERVGENYRIRLLTSEGETREIEARAVVNAAGVFADTLHNMVSSRPLSITPRRGQYFLLDKSAGSHVSHTIFQLPGKLGKGVLVPPTVHGNLLVGPTAENIEDREGTNTTAEGLDSLAPTAARSVRNLPLRQVITSFAGLRAHETGDDFILGEAADAPHFYDAAGIESPGLTAAPAIGEYLAHRIASDLNLSPDPSFCGTRKGFLNPSLMTAAERSELIRRQPAYGNIICRCEMISEGEIIDAIRRTPGGQIFRRRKEKDAGRHGTLSVRFLFSQSHGDSGKRTRAGHFGYYQIRSPLPRH